MTLPRVLLVEDDASIRRFVVLALEELPITLLQAETLAEARQCLAGAPLALLISDLMLPDGSGVELLQELAADAGLQPGMRRVVFSAGISAERRQSLLGLGVHEILAKPVALAELEACVQRALDTAAPAPAVAAQESALTRFFAGNAELFAAYGASCRQQFAQDLQQGDAACAAGDLATLRRLVHSLKTVLLTLGDDSGSLLAAQAESSAAAGSADLVLRTWGQLRQHLQPGGA